METKINNRTKEQGAETKKRLYASAEKLFNQYNYEDVSIDAITKAAGVTKGTFYVHFASKDELYISFFTDYVARIDADYQAFLDELPSDMTSYDIFFAMIEKIADVLVDTIGYDNMKTIYKLQLTRDVSTEAVKGYNRELYKIFSNILAQGVQRGEFKISLSLESLSRHLVMSIRGLTYEWCIRYPDLNLKEQILTHFRLLFYGIMNSIE